MGTLFGIVAPVFALIVMGAVTMWRRWLTTAAIKGMSDFVFFAAMPALLFRAIAEAPPIRLVEVAGSFIGGAVVLFFVTVLISRRAFGARLGQSAVAGLDSVYGNTVMLGIPIVAAAYGPEGVANLLGVIAFHSALLLPLATILIEADTGSGRTPWQVLRASLPGVVSNPVVVSIALAFVWRATGLTFTASVDQFLRLLGQAGPPLALFCLGATLPKPQGMAGMGEVALCTVVKLVAMPALVGVMAHFAGVTGIAFKVVVLASALPTGANAFLLARRFETMMEASASTVVVTTALSVGTLTVLLGWLG